MRRLSMMLLSGMFIVSTALLSGVYAADSTGTVTDIDGNVYKTIKIGNQWWMAENLKVTHYRNGWYIPEVIDSVSWGDRTTGAYCVYANDVRYVDVLGRLYNWYTVADSFNIAPTGWHVPTDAEWQTLVDYLGGDSIAGGTMKVVGKDFWLKPNTGADNKSGFYALPGGFRTPDGYRAAGTDAFFWSSTKFTKNGAYSRKLSFNTSSVQQGPLLNFCGASIRCVKD